MTISEHFDASALMDELSTCPLINSVQPATDNQLERMRRRGLKTNWHAIATYGGIHWSILIGLPSLFPHRLPEILLAEPANEGLLNHVNYEGVVCFEDGEGLSIDSRRPMDILAQAIESALQVLDASRNGDLTGLLDEFEGYWQSLPDCSKAHVLFEPGNDVQPIYALVSNARGKVTCRGFTNDVTGLASGYAFGRHMAGFGREKAIYLPLHEPILPPAPGTLWGAPDLQKLVAMLTPENRQKLELLLTRWQSPTRRAHLLCSQPRPMGGLSFFGISLHGHGPHPLLAPAPAWKSHPLQILRHYPGYLRERAGADTALDRKRVLVAGCGSVGSRIAEQLAQAGIGELTLLDKETLTADNLFRHLLGSEAIGQSKAAALAAHLERRLPYLKITPLHVSFETWLQSNHLGDYDLVTLAMGNPTLERYVNASLYAQDTTPPLLICAWLEPYGIGGHAVLMDGRSPGCLECLFTDAGGESRLTAKTAFLAEGQVASKNLTGCGGAFTDFSMVDATETAIIASRLSLAALRGQLTNAYRCWKGEEFMLRQAGYSTSAWYQQASPEKLALAKTMFVASPCPVCGGATN